MTERREDMEDTRPDAANCFTDEQRLALAQLRALEWLTRAERGTGGEPSFAPEQQSIVTTLPDEWQLTRGVQLYDWQQECVQRWFDNECRGTLKVVTGAGKTLLALAIMERLHNQTDRQLRVAIVVPTIVLMNQWYDEFRQRSNLPPHSLARLGGGYRETFGSDVRVLIAVLDSAAKELPRMVTSAGIGDHLLLVVDECHRAGAPVMSRIFATPRKYSLGLSATPEREEESDEPESRHYAQSLLGRELGGVVYELTLAEAFRRGVVPTYTIHHYGLPLTLEERNRYEQISKVITDLRTELQERAPRNRVTGGTFFAWVRSTANRPRSPLHEPANRFLQATRKRKELLYRIQAREKAVMELLERHSTERGNAQAILFHENIDAVNELFCRLWRAGFPAVLEHSELPEDLRTENLELFRKGVARIIVSARSLIEGFNVPAVDVGIIVASSSSVRQRIQSLGRVLRKHKSSDGTEKSPVVHILYASGTVDELVYEKEDWAEVTGAERNLYFLWRPGSEPVMQDGPPRKPLPSDREISPSSLVAGGIYPGRLEGAIYSCDSQGNVKDAQGRFAVNSGTLARQVSKVLGHPGRFYVTPVRHYVVVRLPDGEDEWVTRFVMQLAEPLRFTEQEPSLLPVREEWLATAEPGTPYPFPLSEPVEPLAFTRRKGGAISKKVPGGTVLARVGREALDPAKGGNAEKLLEAWRRLQAKGVLVYKFQIDGKGDAVYRADGKLFYLCTLDGTLEFPE